MPRRSTVLGALALSLVLSPLIGQVAQAEDDFTVKFAPATTIVGDSIVVPTSEVELVTPKVITAPVVIEPTFAEPVTTMTVDLLPTTTVVEPATVVTPRVVESRAIIPTVVDPTFEPFAEEHTVVETFKSPATETTFLSAASRKPLFNCLSDPIERGVNQLNIDVSNSMPFHPMIGSGSQFQ